jgi:thiol-disulfide isomerase/thioredoxin
LASTAAIFAAIAIVIIILLGGALGLLYLYPKLTHIHLPSVVSNNNSSSSSSSSSPSSTASIAKSVTTCSGNCSPSQLVGTEISTALYSNLTTVSYSTLSSIGSGQGVASPTQVNGSSLTNNGKPEVLFIGAQYCPYCMAEEWSMIVALSKFGNFSGIEYMLSASNYNYSNTPGFTFVGANYSSQYISFVSVEYENRNQSALQPISSSQASLEKKYDPHLEIPFVDIGNQYIVISSQYFPGVLSNLTWTQIGSQLNNPRSSIANAIDGAANLLISALCKIDGGSPSNICSQSFAKLALFPLGYTNYFPLIVSDSSLASRFFLISTSYNSINCHAA